MSGLRVVRDEDASFYGLIGEHPTMLALFDSIQRAAALDAPVVVLGPTGAGKELVAGALHALSGLRGSFCPVSIAELPEGLVESELFGSAKGAFTGAVSDRAGLIEAAAGGTLFLDEGGDLTLSVQAKLLRALETQTVRRVGDSGCRSIRFRLIMAVREDPRALVRSGQWRDDFYYRVTGIVVRVPALAERRSDIPLLAQAFVRTAGLPGLAPDAMEVLLGYAWPGNVRELQRALMRTAHRTSDGLMSAAAVRAALAPPDSGGQTRAHSLVEAKSSHARQVVEACGGDTRQAAAMLGVSRSHLYRLLRGRSSGRGAVAHSPQGESVLPILPGENGRPSLRGSPEA